MALPRANIRQTRRAYRSGNITEQERDYLRNKKEMDAAYEGKGDLSGQKGMFGIDKGIGQRQWAELKESTKNFGKDENQLAQEARDVAQDARNAEVESIKEQIRTHDGEKQNLPDFRSKHGIDEYDPANSYKGAEANINAMLEVEGAKARESANLALQARGMGRSSVAAQALGGINAQMAGKKAELNQQLLSMREQGMQRKNEFDTQAGLRLEGLPDDEMAKLGMLYNINQGQNQSALQQEQLDMQRQQIDAANDPFYKWMNIVPDFISGAAAMYGMGGSGGGGAAGGRTNPGGGAGLGTPGGYNLDTTGTGGKVG